MANKYEQSTNIAKLDTVTASKIFGRKVYVREIRWVNAAAPGDAVVMTDGNDNPLFESVATIAHDRDGIELNCEVEDLKLPTLVSGVVYVYLGYPQHR